jgi:hypothetical protein
VDNVVISNEQVPLEGSRTLAEQQYRPMFVRGRHLGYDAMIRSTNEAQRKIVIPSTDLRISSKPAQSVLLGVSGRGGRWRDCRYDFWKMHWTIRMLRGGVAAVDVGDFGW